jgi:hypothetical protein
LFSAVRRGPSQIGHGPQPFGRIGVTHARPVGPNAAEQPGIQMNTKIRTSTMPTVSPAKLRLAGAAIVLALLAVPHFGHAQGLVRGAEQGSREGDRAAGPVGAVVGGAVGAAVGTVDGALGIHPYRHGCRGFYDRYDHFHCYR